MLSTYASGFSIFSRRCQWIKICSNWENHLWAIIRENNFDIKTSSIIQCCLFETKSIKVLQLYIPWDRLMIREWPHLIHVHRREQGYIGLYIPDDQETCQRHDIVWYCMDFEYRNPKSWVNVCPNDTIGVFLCYWRNNGVGPRESWRSTIWRKELLTEQIQDFLL